MPWFYRLSWLIVWMCCRLFTRWQVKGKENIPNHGPLLVVVNHLHLVDVPLLGVSFDRRLIFMAKKELFRFKFMGYILSRFGAFPVHRGQLDRRALNQAGKILAQGSPLVVFPEGMRSRSSRLRPAYRGSALIALRAKVPILPVGISGSEKLKGITWLLCRPRLTVNIGHPFYLSPVDGRLTRVELDKQTNFIMERIAELLPIEYRGEYMVKKN